MRIGIDARFLTHPQAGGFKTYTQNLVAGLAEVDGENEYVLYVGGEADVPPAPGLNFTLRPVPETLPLAGMVWREQGALPRRVASDRLDVFHAPCLTAPLRLACPLVVTIHDMIWLRELPRRLSLSKHALLDRYYRAVPESAARRAAAVITVSECSRESIAEKLALPPERIHVTYEAANARYRPIEDAQVLAGARAKFDLPPTFLLAMGSADPRKNVDGLFRAYAALPPSLREQCPLAIVWANPHLASGLSDLARTLKIEPQLRFLQGVSNDDLVLLYNSATVFVFPSHYEGFGLPLLEAMACGTPVVAADNSSLPEIAGGAALLVNSKDDGALTQAIERLLTNESLRIQMTDQGKAQAAKFSWARCARETLAVFREIADGR